MSLSAAVDAVRAGKIVGIPTETVYGIGADPLDEVAVARLFDVKGRPENRPVGLLVATIEQAKAAGGIEGAAEELARLHWPGPLTLVVTPKIILADWVGDAQRRTVGIRVPDHPVAQQLLAETGPLAVTSANRSGGAEARSHLEAEQIFGDEVAVYLEGIAPGGEASTVVDATGAELVVIRKGPIEI